jgi:hypothetical protein
MLTDVHIEKLIWKRTIGIWIFMHEKDGRSYRVAPVDMVKKEITPVESQPNPTIEMPQEEMIPFLRALVNAIAESGILGMSGMASDSEKNAIRAHLADMQKMTDRLMAMVETRGV